MQNDCLLAKSKRDDEPWHESMALPVHLQDVYAAAIQVLDATGDDQLQALGLPVEAHQERFRRIVLLAAAVHDLGKANDHFQGMIRRTRNVRIHPQGLRHEWVTVLMLSQLRDWLLPAVGRSAEDFAIVEWAVSGHHPAHNHPTPPSGPPAQGGSGPEITFLVNHTDFVGFLSWLKQTFRLLGDPPLIAPIKRNLVGSETAFGALRHWLRAGQPVWERLKKTADKRLVAAAKNTLIAADVAGSALPKAKPNEPDRWTWIAESFAKKPDPDDLQTIVDHRLKGDTPRDFQRAVASSKHRVTFVKAG